MSENSPKITAFVHDKIIDEKQFVLIHVGVNSPITFSDAKEIKVVEKNDQFKPSYYMVNKNKRIHSDIQFWLGTPPLDSPPDWFDDQITWENTPDDNYTTGYLSSNSVITVQDIVTKKVERRKIIDVVAPMISNFFKK